MLGNDAAYAAALRLRECVGHILFAESEEDYYDYGLCFFDSGFCSFD